MQLEDALAHLGKRHIGFQNTFFLWMFGVVRGPSAISEIKVSTKAIQLSRLEHSTHFLNRHSVTLAAVRRQLTKIQ